MYVVGGNAANEGCGEFGTKYVGVAAYWNLGVRIKGGWIKKCELPPK